MYSLPAGLHCARANGRLVFLDVPSDRYFCLPPELEQALIVSQDGAAGQISEAERRLLESGLLAEADGGGVQIGAAAPPLVRSLVEEPVPCTVSGHHLVSVASAMLTARWRHRRRTLSERIAEAKERRSRISKAVADEIAIERAARFLHLRPFLPWKHLCLPDSLALLAYLGPAGASAKLVIGVTMDPFAAHCWIQLDTLLLNDRLDHARAFTPILVV